MQVFNGHSRPLSARCNFLHLVRGSSFLILPLKVVRWVYPLKLYPLIEKMRSPNTRTEGRERRGGDWTERRRDAAEC